MARVDAQKHAAPGIAQASGTHSRRAKPDAALPVREAAPFIFRIAAGSAAVLGGIDLGALRGLVDSAEHLPDDRRALFMSLQPGKSVDAYVEQVIAALAETAMRLWPDWFTGVSFAVCRNDAPGRRAARAIVRAAAARMPRIDRNFAEAAIRLVLAGRPPRVAGTLPAIELAQLSLAVSGAGLVFVADANAAATAAPEALAHALEFVAQQASTGVVALFNEPPPPASPFDRVMYGARRVIADDRHVAHGEAPGPAISLAPWTGAPHPLSEIEQRLHARLALDAELAGLFSFNRPIATVRGSRPKVDLAWVSGRLVVELDGYADHATRRAFVADRHRDYELALSGYTVLRLANDEIVQDFGRAIEKIRDLVRLRRSQMNREAS